MVERERRKGRLASSSVTVASVLREAYLRSRVRDVLPNQVKITARRRWVRVARLAGYPISSQRLSRPALIRGRRELRLTRALVACDANPFYLDCWPLVSRAWSEILGLEPILVLVAAESEVPSGLLADARVRLFPPVDGIHAAFQAQCIRLLYPALLDGEGAVVISDMDLIPLLPRYFHGALGRLDARFFVSYRDVLHSRRQVAIAYNAAEPETWRDLTGVRGEDDVGVRLREWYDGVEYQGERGGSGWYTDQLVLFKLLMEWHQRDQRLWMLDDDYAGHRRLERDAVAAAGKIGTDLRADLLRGRYADFHAVLPHSRFHTLNEEVVEVAISSHRGLM
jgi:hypothetical protein